MQNMEKGIFGEFDEGRKGFTVLRVFHLPYFTPCNLRWAATTISSWNAVTCDLNILVCRYKEDVFIMEEQSNDTMPIPVGGFCSQCNRPCCLRPSCSSVHIADNKRYCHDHTSQ